LIVGVRLEDSNSAGDPDNNDFVDSGAAYVFTRSGTTWGQQAYLKASNAFTGDNFGTSVDIDADTAIVGAPNEDSDAIGVNGSQANDNSPNSGAAYVFTRSGSTWTQQAYVKASNPDSGDTFGSSVTVEGETAAIGAPHERSSARGVGGDQSSDTVVDAGAAYAFVRSSGTWSQQVYIKAPNASVSDFMGSSIDLSGDRLLVGALNAGGDVSGVNAFGEDSSIFSGGAAYLYSRSSSVWTTRAYIKPSNPDTGDQFGESLSVSGDRIVIGSRLEDSNATVINGDGTDDTFANSGAAYAFGPPCATAPFSDVPTSHPFCAAIEWMDQTGISTGFGDGTFRPSTSVTRQAMAAFMARFKSAALTACSAPPFTDVPIDHPFCEEIQWVSDTGISAGFNDGTYRPTTVVTRQGMAAFMARLAGVPSPPICSTPPFSDVPTTNAFCKEIQWMKVNGISTGFGDGTYRPADPVTRQAMAAFMYRVSAFLLKAS
jgi:hypothetical protein